MAIFFNPSATSGFSNTTIPKQDKPLRREIEIPRYEWPSSVDASPHMPEPFKGTAPSQSPENTLVATPKPGSPGTPTGVRPMTSYNWNTSPLLIEQRAYETQARINANRGDFTGRSGYDIPSATPGNASRSGGYDESRGIPGKVDNMRKYTLGLRRGTPQVKGPKGIDKVPAMLTAGEAVLPVKTVKAMGGPAAIKRLITETNGKPPRPEWKKVKGKGVRAHAEAGVIDITEPFDGKKPWLHPAVAKWAAPAVAAVEGVGDIIQNQGAVTKDVMYPQFSRDALKAVAQTGAAAAGNPLVKWVGQKFVSEGVRNAIAKHPKLGGFGKFLAGGSAAALASEGMEAVLPRDLAQQNRESDVGDKVSQFVSANRGNKKLMQEVVARTNAGERIEGMGDLLGRRTAPVVAKPVAAVPEQTPEAAVFNRPETNTSPVSNETAAMARAAGIVNPRRMVGRGVQGGSVDGRSTDMETGILGGKDADGKDHMVGDGSVRADREREAHRKTYGGQAEEYSRSLRGLGLSRQGYNAAMNEFTKGMLDKDNAGRTSAAAQAAKTSERQDAANSKLFGSTRDALEKQFPGSAVDIDRAANSFSTEFFRQQPKEVQARIAHRFINADGTPKHVSEMDGEIQDLFWDGQQAAANAREDEDSRDKWVAGGRGAATVAGIGYLANKWLGSSKMGLKTKLAAGLGGSALGALAGIKINDIWGTPAVPENIASMYGGTIEGDNLVLPNGRRISLRVLDAAGPQSSLYNLKDK